MWTFIQDEILGMKWLNRLIGRLLSLCGLDIESKVGGSVQFFLYDTIKIMVLLSCLWNILLMWTKLWKLLNSLIVSNQMKTKDCSNGNRKS